MVIGNSRALVKHVFENQHKLKKIVRLCSSSLRIKEYEDVSAGSHHDDIRAADLTSIPDRPYLPNAKRANRREVRERSFKFSDLNVTLAAPDQLQVKPKAEDLQFGKCFTDHMLKVAYYKQLGGWQKPEIVPFSNISLHPAAKVLHYAIELFEGMKAYRGEDGKIRMFRPELNMERMNVTAIRAGLPAFDSEEMIKCMSRLISIDQEWVPHAEAASLYIRPTFIGIDPTLGVSSSDSALLYTILCPVSSYFKGAGKQTAISLLADPAYTRAWYGGVGDRKMGSNYAPTVDIHTKAAEKGLHQALWLYGDDHHLTEAGTMNVFMVAIDDDGAKCVWTPPLDGLILPGVTRHSILQLVEHWGLRTREAPIPMRALLELRARGRLLELFGSGTACIVSPIGHIEYLGEGVAIPTLEQPDGESVFGRVQAALAQIQYGRLGGEHSWARPI